MELKTNDTIKIIEAVGGQWPFLLVLFAIVVIIIKWKTIWSFNFKQVKIKSGTNEFKIQGEKSENKKVEEKDKDYVLAAEKRLSGDSNSERDNEEENEEELSEKPFVLYHRTIQNRNFNESNKILKTLIDSEKDEELKEIYKANDYYLRHSLGDDKAFSELEEYCEREKEGTKHKALALRHLGNIYNETNNYEKAISVLSNAITTSPDELQKAKNIDALAKVHYDNENFEEATNVYFESLGSFKDKSANAELYNYLGELYKRMNKKLFASVAFQKALEYTPNNTSFLFSAAYNYSDLEPSVELEDLAILLYNRILKINPNYGIALNNSAVAHDKLKMPIEAVSFYKKALENENSLASSNLAYIYFRNGFYDEADEILRKAMMFKNVHNNVHEARDALVKAKASEQKEKGKVLENGRKKYNFFNGFGSSAFSKSYDHANLLGTWTMNGIDADISFRDNYVYVSWTINEKEHEISGTMENNAIICEYERPEKEKYSISDDSYTNRFYNGYGYFKNEFSAIFLIFLNEDFLEMELKRVIEITQ